MLLALPLLLALSAAATPAPAPSRQSLEREVGRFVDLWLAAQNQGQFEVGESFSDMVSARPNNIFMAKLTYYLSL